MKTAAFALALVLFTACSHDENADVSQDTPSASSTTLQSPTAAGDRSATMNPTVPTASDMPGQQAGGAAMPMLQVQLQEYDIRMEEALPAGHQALTVVNSGREDHSLVIEGNGVRQALPSVLKRGDSNELHMNLPSGTYTAYCPVEGHRQKGMERKIVVK